MKCRNCGRKIQDNSIFCNWCGSKQLVEKRKKNTTPIPAARQLSSGRWFIQLRVEGVSKTFNTKAECEAWARAVRAGFVEAKRTRKKSFEEAGREYISNRSKVLSPSTLNGYECIIKTRFPEIWGKDIGEKLDWQKIINLEASRCGAKTLKNAWGFISAVMRVENITPPTVALPQIIRKERPWLDFQQIQIFLDAVKGKSCELAALLALHSLRRSEIMALTMDKIDLENGMIFVEGSVVPGQGNKFVYKDTNKNQSSRRRVPIMIPRLFELLHEHKGCSGALITCSANSLHGKINAVCEKAGLPLVGVHGLRSSAASLAYHLGWSELETMHLGGWSDFKTMHERYIKLASEDEAQSIKKMREYFSDSTFKSV